MKAAFFVGILMLAVSPVGSYAQQPVPVGKEIVVTATRTPIPVGELLNDVSVITQEEIRKSGQSTLTQLLQSQPGIEISSNGGMGAASSVLLRGANSGHTLVLVDGVRINSATTGSTAFENIPVSQIERVEILRGPASSLYGADAIGGVIQIFTKAGSGKPHVNASVGFGSYNTQMASGGFGGEIGDTHFSLQAGYTESDNISSIRNPLNANYNRDRDAYRNKNASAKVSHKFGADHEVGLNAFTSQGRAHYDSSFPSAATDYLTDQTLSEYSVYTRNRFLPAWQSTLRLGTGSDSSTNVVSVARGTIRTDQDQVQWQNDIAVGPGNLILGAEALKQRVSGDINYNVKQRTIRSYLIGYQGSIDQHSLQVNARSDENSQFGHYNTGAISYGYRFTPLWRASVSAGTGFKAPTFNDLYFPGFSNPNLLPEKANNREAALNYDNGVHRLGAVYYDNRITDLIVFTTLPFNVNRAHLKGVTLSYQGEAAGYKIRSSLDYQEPKDEVTGLLLPRRARRHGEFAASKAFGNLEVGTELLLSSARYDDAANTKRLAGYGLTNLFANYALSKELSLSARVNNLFDSQYELARDFGTPGTNLFVSLQYQPR